MPIPKPHSNETQDQYVGRCVSFLVNEGTEQEQAVAICLNEWENNKELKPKIKAMKYTAKQILNDKKGALNEKMLSTETKNKKGYHVATKQAINGDIIKAVGNTFNFFDYDADVLTPESVTDTLKNRQIPVYHLKDHKFSTDGLIGAMQNIYVDKVLTDEYGSVDSLVFESKIKGFEWYKEGVISQHSIGFRYEDIKLAIRDDEEGEEKLLWNKYINTIINKEEAEELGFFYLVDKINLFEISAVLRGANRLTSTLKSNDCNNMKTAYELLNNLNFKL